MYRKYYEILGLTDGASLEKVKNTYRKLALKYHPDRHPDKEEPGGKMTEINAAYSILYRYLQKKSPPSASINTESDLKIDDFNDSEYWWLYSKQPVQKNNYNKRYSKRLIFLVSLFWLILTVFCFLTWWCSLSLLLFVPLSVTFEVNEGAGALLLLISICIFFPWFHLFKQLIFIKVEQMDFNVIFGVNNSQEFQHQYLPQK
ncbi:J domain-containing protein [Planctomycetota bacterium]